MTRIFSGSLLAMYASESIFSRSPAVTEDIWSIESNWATEPPQS